MDVLALKIRGSYKGLSGYERVVREIVRALVNKGVAIQLVSVPGWGSPEWSPHLRDRWFDKLSSPVPARICLQICPPHLVIRNQHLIDVNLTMFEAARIPPSWVEIAREINLTVVPSDFCRRAWIESGAPASRVQVIPFGINPTMFARSPEPLPLRSQTGELVENYGARFINVSELNPSGPRKNLPGLLRSWLRATAHGDNAILILKFGHGQEVWWDWFRKQIRPLEQFLGKRLLEDAAPVHVIYDYYSDEDMARLYATATHYISMSHGEAAELPMLEAAAGGLTLITPNHSGYATYVDSSIAHMIPSREVAAVFPGSIGQLFNGTNWWSPDEGAAAGIIQAVIAGCVDQKNARKRVLREFTWEVAANQLVSILETTKE